MSWKLRKIEIERGLNKATGEIPKPGDWWYCPWYLDNCPKDMDFNEWADFYFSKEYRRDWLGKRPPICVCLPGGVHWMIDGKAKNGVDGSGWVVTGSENAWTAQPSIAVSNYHGWLRNGELTDDCEGRKF